MASNNPQMYYVPVQKQAYDLRPLCVHCIIGLGESLRRSGALTYSLFNGQGSSSFVTCDPIRWCPSWPKVNVDLFPSSVLLV